MQPMVLWIPIEGIQHVRHAERIHDHWDFGAMPAEAALDLAKYCYDTRDVP